MRRLAFTVVPLLLLACDQQPAAPDSAVPAAPSFAGHGAVIETYRLDLPVDGEYSPIDFPCLTEPIHVTGSYEEHLVLVTDPTGGLHLSVHQTTKDVTAVGVTTGVQYRYSGPLQQNMYLPPDGVDVVSFTFHNINHFVGPAGLPDLYLRTLFHFTVDPDTGIWKAAIWNDEVLCH